VTIAPREGLVPVEERLDAIPAGGETRKASDRIAERARIHRRLPAGGEPVDIDAEHELRGRTVTDLEPRLGGRIGRKQEQESPVERRGAPRRGEADPKGRASERPRSVIAESQANRTAIAIM
jgi:hypothetical protein